MNIVADFLLGLLFQMGNLLAVQFLNLAVFWQLLPIYSTWFATLFITRGREYEDEANRFLNGFAILWVGFQLGEYVIENFFTDPMIIWKAIFVVILFIYAYFVMKLVLQGKEITKYIARIGEISTINIAAMLFVQDILAITSIIQFFQLLLAFIIIYVSLDAFMTWLTKYLWKRMGKPIEEEKAPPTPPPKPVPRYERITAPPTRPRPVAPPRPVTPPTYPTTPRPARPAYPARRY